MGVAAREWTVLGLMSGTSMDGVDACLARLDLADDGLGFECLDAGTIAFESDDKAAIRRSLTGNADDLAGLHARLGTVYAEVAEHFLRGRTLDLVGCHGQTVAHRDGQYTLQLGSTALLSQRLQVPVVSNFRDADLAAGGNGAPLMPFLDWLLAKSRPTPTVLVNIGGVANISAILPGADRDAVTGFDTGPGMGLIDEAAQSIFSESYDQDGRLSSPGEAHDGLLAQLMAHPFVLRQPPKSTGRDEFGGQLVARLNEQFQLPPADTLRTLVRFTARSVAANIRQFVPGYKQFDTLIVSGGGVHHPLVMADLQAEFPTTKVVTSKALGIDPDYKEALLVAVLAVAHAKGMAGNMPGVTGAGRQVILGQVTSVQEI